MAAAHFRETKILELLGCRHVFPISRPKKPYTPTGLCSDIETLPKTRMPSRKRSATTKHQRRSAESPIRALAAPLSPRASYYPTPAACVNADTPFVKRLPRREPNRSNPPVQRESRMAERLPCPGFGIQHPASGALSLLDRVRRSSQRCVRPEEQWSSLLQHSVREGVANYRRPG